ncbi:MAG TPA: hypothetical protein VM661_01580 [Candidatus Sulfotelmatobacter sp.]|jgi:hypothetical protein|nr:hypothetical protein [Candidatus Sulfotelmatobacter sp.]
MRYNDDEGRYFLETLQVRAQSKFEQIRHQLLPDSPAGMTVEQLQDALFKRMAEMPPEQQADMKVKAGIALIEMDVMVRELREHLTELGRQVAATTRKTAAVSAYGRASGLMSGRKSSAW